MTAETGWSILCCAVCGCEDMTSPAGINPDDIFYSCSNGHTRDCAGLIICDRSGKKLRYENVEEAETCSICWAYTELDFSKTIYCGNRDCGDGPLCLGCGDGGLCGYCRNNRKEEGVGTDRGAEKKMEAVLSEVRPSNIPAAVILKSVWEKMADPNKTDVKKVSELLNLAKIQPGNITNKEKTR